MESGEAGKRRGRKGAKRAGGMDEGPRKRTFVLSAKHDWKLAAYASMRGIDRSAVIAELIEERLGSMVVSFRGPRAGEAVEPPRIVRDEAEGEGAAA